MADGDFRFKVNGYDSYDIRLGEELRGERATLGKSLLNVQKDLRIKAAYISAIENCDLNAFPNKGFIAGYVRSYARYLNLNPETTFEVSWVRAQKYSRTKTSVYTECLSKCREHSFLA